MALEDAREAKAVENKVELVRTAAKFLHEDRERAWEARVSFSPFARWILSDTGVVGDGREREATGIPAAARERFRRKGGVRWV